MANEDKLLDFNLETALSHMLAAEEHMIGHNGIDINQWCSKKHLKLARDHHIFEASELTEKSNPELSKKLSNLRDQIKTDGNMKASDIRDLRNEFREIIGDKTLKCNGLCALDRSKSSVLSEVSLQESSEESSNVLPIVLVVAGILGILIFAIGQKKY